MSDEETKRFGEVQFLMVMVSLMKISPYVLKCDFEGFVRYVSANGNDGPIPGQKEQMLRLARLMAPVKEQMERISDDAEAFGKVIEKAGTN